MPGVVVGSQQPNMPKAEILFDNGERHILWEFKSINDWFGPAVQVGDRIEYVVGMSERVPLSERAQSEFRVVSPHLEEET
jgi:hypothetical protein